MKVTPEEWNSLKLKYAKGTEEVKHYRRLRRKAAKAHQRSVLSGKNSEVSFDRMRETQRLREEVRKDQRSLHLVRMYSKGVPYSSVEASGSKPVDFDRLYWHSNNINKIVRWVHA